MAEVQRLRRPPNDREVSVVHARIAHRQQAFTNSGHASQDAGFVALLGATLVAIVALGWARGWFDDLVLVGLAGGYGVALMVVAALGWRAHRTYLRQRVDQLSKQQAARLDHVHEITFEAQRGRTASGPHGDGVGYWAFELPSGRWLVFCDEQWDLLEPPAEWRDHNRVCLDAWNQVVALEQWGGPIEVDRREIRPPDFDVTPAHRFWEPPEGAIVPCVVEDFSGTPP